MSARQRSPKGTDAPYYDRKRKLWIGEVALGLDARGKRARKRITGRDRDDVLRRLRKVRHDVDNGLPVTSQTDTLSGWLGHYFDTIAPRRCQPATVRQDRRQMRLHVEPTLGRKPLAKLTPEHVERLMVQLEAAGSAPASVLKVRAILCRALNVAQRRGKVARNVVMLTDAPEQTRRTGDALTLDEVEAVLAAAAAGRPTFKVGTNTPSGELEPDRLAALATVVLTLGLRRSEALRMRWCDVDWKARTLYVRGTKSKTSERTIPLPDTVADALRAHQRAQRVERLAAPAWADADLVFASTVGTVVDGRNALRWWHALTERAGIGRRRFHASRHTAAMVMRARGVDLSLVSAILGHSGLQITHDIYARPDVELLRSAADAIDAAYSTKRASK